MDTNEMLDHVLQGNLKDRQDLDPEDDGSVVVKMGDQEFMVMVVDVTE